VIFQQIFFRHEKALEERNAKKRIAAYTFHETSSIFPFHGFLKNQKKYFKKWKIHFSSKMRT
jgi:hypothetical protein